MARSKKKKSVKIISQVFAYFLILTYLVFSYMILKLDMIPMKYAVIIFGVLTIIVGVLSVLLLIKKIKNGIKYASMVISLIFTIIFGAGVFYISETEDFMKKIGINDTIMEKYYVVVNTDSEYKKIADLKGKNIGTFDEKMDIYDEAIKLLKEDVSAKLKKYESVQDMSEELLNEKLDGIIISANHKDVIDEGVTGFKDLTTIIHTIEVEVEVKNQVEHADIDISSEVFNVYISGTDSYGSIQGRSRSDVNMIATINPKTNEVLLTSIPRDYYVQLHGTTGYKDKLTHAGMYGAEKSIKTIEDFMDIEIDYYVKVNFSTLIGLVDTIGGIDVYSDTAFVPWTDRSVYIPKGMVHMNGKMAIAFARERYAYFEGDRHRIQNQQDVLTAIINKAMKSPAILTKYTELLEKLSNSFETNVNIEEVTGLIKLQIDKMPSWTIKKYSLNGRDSENCTYSFGSQKLYVMEPDEETIKIGSKYINGMKDGKKFSELGIN